MGLAQSGKTTIVKVTAEGMIPQKKAAYSATLDYKRNTYNLFGTKVSMFDLGGQKSFLDRFIGELAEFVFTNVSALIFVIDISNMDTISLAKYYYDLAKKTLKKYSPKAKTHILIHKMDLIDQSKKDDFISSVKEFLDFDPTDQIFETNVFDKSIFMAMEKIIRGLGDSVETFEGVVERFKESNAEHLDVISIKNGANEELIAEQFKNNVLAKYENRISMNNSSQTIAEDKVYYILCQYDWKIVFQSSIGTEHRMLIIFDKVTMKLINNSIRLVTDLTKFF